MSSKADLFVMSILILFILFLLASIKSQRIRTSARAYSLYWELKDKEIQRHREAMEGEKE